MSDIALPKMWPAGVSVMSKSWPVGPADGAFFAEFQNAFDPFAGNPSVHQLGGGRAENDFAMERCVIGMGVADEDQFLLWPARVEPQPQVRQVNAAFAILHFKRRHT